MKRTLIAAALVAALLAVAFILAAIWTHGTDLPGRFLGTATVFIVLAVAAGLSTLNGDR